MSADIIYNKDKKTKPSFVVIQAKLRHFLTDVVTKWNAGQKMAFFMLLMTFEILNYVVWMLYIKHSSYAQQFVNIDIINTMLWWALGTIALIICFGYLFYHFQHRTRFIHVFQLVVMILYSFGAGYVGYLVGEDNIMSAIAISTAGVLIVLFCERKFAYWIVGLNFVCMFTIMYASKTGIFPPPNFYVGTQDSAFWVYTYIHLCGLKVIIILTLTDNMLFVLQESYHNSKFMSEHDVLTGLPNRLNTQIYLLDSIQKHHHVGLIMIDLDYFKQVNDNFGHLFGDRVLVAVADVLSQHLRLEDMLGRYGGEEFVLVMPNTNLAEATAVAHRLHEAFNTLEVKLGSGETVDSGKTTDTGKILKPTASFGVVASDYFTDSLSNVTHEDIFKRLFEMADAAMYCAKHNGRNQVVSACDIPPAFLQHASKISSTHTDLNVITS